MFRQVRRYLLIITILVIPLSIFALIASYRTSFNISDPNNYPYKFSIQSSFNHPAYGAQDYDKDGYSEIFIAYEPIQMNLERTTSIQVFSPDFKIIEQLNTDEYIRGPLNFWDLDSNGKEEVLICTNNSDTAFLDIRQIPDKRLAKFPIAFTDEYTNKVKGEWVSTVNLLDVQDIDANGLNDLILLVTTLYQDSPRGLYCYEYPTGRKKWISRIGAAPPYQQVADLNGNGDLEYIIGATTPNNCKIEINGTVDTLAYFMIFDKHGNNLVCEQHGLNGTWIFPWLGDINRDGVTDCIVIENNFQNEAAKLDNKIYRYDSATARLIPVSKKTPRKFLTNIVDDFDNDGFIDVFLLDTKNYATIYTFVEDGKSLVLNKDNDLKIAGLQENVLAKAFDLNLDGRKEIILQGKTGIYVLDSDLNVKAIFPDAREPCLVKRRDSKPYLLVNKIDNKGCYTLRYERNNAYMLYRFKSIGLFLSLLGIIVSFLIASNLIRQITRLPLLTQPDRLWLEINAKFRIIQMSYELKKLLATRTVSYSSTLDSIFDSPYAENIREFIASKDFRQKNPRLLIQFAGLENKNYSFEIIKLPVIFKKPNHIVIFNETGKESLTKFNNWLTLIRAQVHNLKNPLTTALMQISRLKKDLQDKTQKNNEQKVARCDDLEQEIIQSKNVTNKFLNFIDAWQRKPRPCDVNEKIKTLTKLLMQQYESIPAIKFNLSPDLPIIRIGHDLLDIVIENIFRNAIEATESSGEIIISTSLQDQSESISQPMQRMINIEILDTGAGIDEQDLQTIFTSHVSTKRGGTGIGLSLTKEILQWLGGSIEIQSKIDLGTTVNIYIPTESNMV